MFLRTILVALAFVCGSLGSIGCAQIPKPIHRLPGECYKVDRRLYAIAEPPVFGADSYTSDFSLKIVDAIKLDHDAIQRQTVTGRGRSNAIENLYERDSTSTLLALAFIIGESGWPAPQDALVAAQYYRSRQWNPDPILWVLSRPMNDFGRSVGLSALAGVKNERQAQTILGMACDAGYLLIAWRTTDPEYADHAAGKAEVLLADGVMMESYRLLGDPYLPILDKIAAAIDSGSMSRFRQHVPARPDPGI